MKFNNVNRVGKRIKELRKNKKMTQSEIANLIGVATQTIHKYENGIIDNIPLDKIIRISEILNVSTNYIIMGTDTPELSDEEFEKLKKDTKYISKMKSLEEITYYLEHIKDEKIFIEIKNTIFLLSELNDINEIEEIKQIIQFKLDKKNKK